VTAEFRLGVAQMHGVAALSENPGAFHSGRACADDEHRPCIFHLLKYLGIPAAAIFLADRLVLRAHDLTDLVELRHADIAADALADILEASRPLERVHFEARRNGTMVAAGAPPACSAHISALNTAHALSTTQWQKPTSTNQSAKFTLGSPDAAAQDELSSAASGRTASLKVAMRWGSIV